MKKSAKVNLLIVFISVLATAAIYLFFEQQWRSMHRDSGKSFDIQFLVQCVLSFCLAGVGFLPSFTFFIEVIAKLQSAFDILFVIVEYYELNGVPIFMHPGPSQNSPPLAAIVFLCLGVLFWGYLVVKRRIKA